MVGLGNFQIDITILRPEKNCPEWVQGAVSLGVGVF
jgi:hypothetical protein